MSHLTKFLLRTLMQRVRIKIRTEIISTEQFNFITVRHKKSHFHAQNGVETIYRSGSGSLSICFIDYMKEFNRPQHDELFMIPSRVNVDVALTFLDHFCCPNMPQLVAIFLRCATKRQNLWQNVTACISSSCYVFGLSFIFYIK